MKINHKGKIYLSIIKISFIALFATVMGITIIFFAGVQFSINNQIKLTNEVTLKQITLNVDNIMVKKAEDVANSIVYQYPDFDVLIAKNLNGNQIEYKRLIEYMAGVVQYSPQIRSIYIYSDKTKLLVTNNFVTDIDNQASKERLDLDWMEKMQFAYYWSSWLPARETKEEPGNYSISYMKTFVAPKCAIVVNFREEYIKDYIGEFFAGNQGSFYLTDSNNRILSTNAREERFSRLEQTETAGVWDKKVQSESPLQIDGWKLVSSINKEYFLGGWDDVIFILIASCILMLIIVLILVKRFTDKIYRPITELTVRAKGMLETDIESKSRIDEGKVITQAMNSLSVRADSIEKLFADSIPVIQNNILRTMIDGNFNNENLLRQKLKSVGKDCNGAMFQAVVIILDHYKALSGRLEVKNLEIIKMNVIETLKEEIGQKAVYLADEVLEGRFVCILNFNDADFNLSELLAEFQKKFRDEFQTTLTIAVGGAVLRPTDISISYRQAMYALQYIIISPAESVLRYVLLSGAKELSGKVIESYSEIACEIIKSRAIERIPEFCSSLIDDFAKNKYTIESIEFALKEIVVYINRKLGVLFSYDDIINNNDSLDSIEQTRADLAAKLELCYNYYNKDKDTQAVNLVESIKRYVDENIGADVSLTKIAGVFYISTSQLSKIFKEGTQVTLNEYIIQVRIDRAKQLLLKGMKVTDVTMALGYSSSAYFIRQFKKTVGMTPKQYQVFQNIYVENDIEFETE